MLPIPRDNTVIIIVIVVVVWYVGENREKFLKPLRSFENVTVLAGSDSSGVCRVPSRISLVVVSSRQADSVKPSTALTIEVLRTSACAQW